MSTVKMCDQCGDTRRMKDYELGDWITISMGAGEEITQTREFCTAACAQLGLEHLQLEHTVAMIEAVEAADEDL